MPDRDQPEGALGRQSHGLTKLPCESWHIHPAVADIPFGIALVHVLGTPMRLGTDLGTSLIAS
jgi:hypothetical protein